MKRFLIAIALALASITQAHAGTGWYWKYDNSTGYFLKTDGVDTDGFLYVRKGYCPPYDYVEVKATPKKVAYQKGWQELMANNIFALQDRQAFLESQRLLLGASGGAGYSQEYSSATIQRGVGVQPFAYTPSDPDYLAHALERTTLRMTDTAGQSVAALADATHKALENNKQVLLYQAFRESVQPSPTTETYTFNQGSVSGAVSALRSTDAVANMRQMLAQANCAQCHSGNNRTGLDIMGIAAYTDEDRAAIRDESLDRMVGTKSSNDATRMPQNHPKLTDIVANAIADWIWLPKPTKTYSFKSKVQTQAEGPPPEPHP